MIEKQLARRQLAVKGDKSRSWFICIESLLLKYKLPTPWKLLDMPPPKVYRKKQVKEQVDNYWSDIMSLEWFCTQISDNFIQQDLSQA